MTDRPILFSAPMVKALLSGTKTQTRRIIKLPTKKEYVRPDMGGWEATTVGGEGCFYANGYAAPEKVAIWNQTTGTCVVIPYQIGDRLYVRETWATIKGYPRVIAYRADGCIAHTDLKNNRWRPSIHMPRWASRLTLEVTDVRVERVQDISEEDARAEGVGPLRHDGRMHNGLPASDGFADLWDSINEKRGYGWRKNPWVSVVSFKVHKINIDAMEKAE